MKVLYRDTDTYYHQGNYPFTDPVNKFYPVQELGNLNPERLNIVEAAYIGHIDNKVIFKKMIDVKLDRIKVEIETVDDNFEELQVGNEVRFKQFLNIMKMNSKSPEMAMRVVIN